MDFSGEVEDKRDAWQCDLMEICNDESEANVQIANGSLQTKRARLDNERESNLALFQIADADSGALGMQGPFM